VNTVVTKECRSAWWKFALVALLVVATLIGANLPTPYEEIVKIARANAMTGTVTIVPNVDLESGEAAPVEPRAETVDLPTNSDEMALTELWAIYGSGGGTAMVLLAALLGVGLISGEVSRNTIFLLLSKPVSRTRLLLTKYAVCAGVLLLAAGLRAIVLMVAAAFKDYPLAQVSYLGVALSVVLLWLGSLSVLGVALLASVLFGDVIKSVAVTIVALYLMLAPASWINYFLWDEYHALGLSDEFPYKATLFFYWSSEALFLGEAFETTNFLVCLVAAVAVLVAALWLFRRKAY
jgi:ABC-2 type transport system permease protein